MKYRICVLVILLALTPPAVVNGQGILYGKDRVWHEVATLPEGIYQEFLRLPKENVGYADTLLNRGKPQSGRIIMMTDLRGHIAIFFFRGVPGGTGFVIPEDWLRIYREYVLEIRWQDSRTGRWHFWWNREKLDNTLLIRPELYPQAYNAPF